MPEKPAPNAKHTPEQELLACCIRDGAPIIDRCVSEGITPNSFLDPRNAAVFDVLIALTKTQDAIAPESILRRLASGEASESFLSELNNAVEATSRFEYNLAFVRLQSPMPAGSGLKKAAQGIRRVMENGGELAGLSTGFKDLDTLTFGLNPGDMIVLASRPSLGKSALAMNIVEAVTIPKKGTPSVALVFSFEMSAAAYMNRMLLSRAKVGSERVRGGFVNRAEQERIAAAASELKAAPIFIDDSPEQTVQQIRDKARRLHGKNRLGLIVIDYLQLIQPHQGGVAREQYIAEISREIKAMARELAVPVIILAQLNRDSDKERRQPRMSDLRDSGALEQDADLVLLLGYPRELKDDFSVAVDHADLIVAKQRNGPVGEVRLTFLREITRFENYAD